MMTVKDFLSLTAMLGTLPGDTELTIGIGQDLFCEDEDTTLAAARRELVAGDALTELAVVGILAENGGGGRGVRPRLVLDSEYAIHRDTRPWRDYIYNEAMRLHIIEPNDKPLNTHGYEKDSDNHRRAADPDGRLYPGGRDFDPDRDAIGI